MLAMMYSTLRFLGVIILFSNLLLVQAWDTCGFPPAQAIDWNKLSRHSWYQIFGHHMSEVRRVAPCLVMDHIKKTSTGFTATLEDYVVAKKKYEGIPITSTREKSGSYKWQPTHESKWVEISEETHKHLNPEIFKELDAAYGSSRNYYTDYKNYLIVFYCAKDGEKYIVVASPNRHPTAKDALRVTNKLIKLGHGWNNVKLQLSGCAKAKSTHDS